MTHEVWNTVGVVVPAYCPDDQFLPMIDGLLDMGVQHIFVVNDGSGKDFDALFKQAKQKGATVLYHAQNLGKGRALKTAFNYALVEHPNLIGTVTADADGQHTSKDIFACAKALAQNPSALVLGCRDFSESHVPITNSIGNRVTRSIISTLCRTTIQDSQTGLRAIPASFMKALLGLKGERFEFETNMLLETRALDIPIEQVPIQTVYFPGNPSSHFNPLRDGLRIYALFANYIGVSLLCSLVDIGLFTLILWLLSLFIQPAEGFTSIAIATASARVCSGILNYCLNRAVFATKKSVKSSGIKYFALFISQIILSSLLVWSIGLVLPISNTLVKVVVDLCLFFFSFHIQNKFIF